jgi:aubergine-like protein
LELLFWHEYGNYRTYKIEAFDYKRGPQSTFDKNGEKVTFKEYFKKAYNVSIKDNDQPLIITSITKK